MRILRERVVLAKPHVFPIEAISVNRILNFAGEHGVLSIWVVSCRAGQVPIEKQAEFHVLSSRSNDEI
jgi:hypothetical protein